MDGQTLSADLQLILRLEDVTGRPGLETVPIAPHGRDRYVAMTAALGGRQPIGETQDLRVPTPDGPRAARLYVPTGSTGGEALLVYLHGGGMIYGDLETH